MENNLKYEIISTGSKGNCMWIENIVIDVGITLKDFNKPFTDFDYLLITHLHGDHVKLPLLKKFKRKRTYVNQSTYDKYYEKVFKDFTKLTVVGDEDEIFLSPDIKMRVFNVPHDVPCNAFHLTFYTDEEPIEVLYATDLSSTDTLPRDTKFNYMFLENNYDVDILHKALQNPKLRARAQGNQRHLSNQQARVYRSRYGAIGCVYERMHKSSQFNY